jgi:hypothetical protein
MTEKRLDGYSLLDALIERRSRRFAPGMRMNGGPLAYQSTQPPQPLSLEEEAALAFAGCGVTGYALAELPYATGDVPEASCGNIITHFIGRTVGSGDAMHTVVLFVINDEGAWMLRRPQDYPRADIPQLIQAARDRQFLELYERSRVRVGGGRVDVPREIPFVPSFNKWAANLPGTTYYLPVNELSALYINILLTAFGEEFGFFFVDERNGCQPAGVAQFSRSAGGHLQDDPSKGRLLTVGTLEAWLLEFTAIEQGGVLQNLGLMTQALGLGGFPHFAAHPFIWFQALGFRMEPMPFSRAVGLGPGTEGEMQIPSPVGLEKDGEVLIRPYCPPYYRSMEEAVLAFVEYKCGQGSGTFRDSAAAGAWQDGTGVQAGIPGFSDQAIAATIAYCEYIYGRYGRFPGSTGPFRTVLAHQAHHLDLEFYDRFYRPDALTDAQRHHADRWHG